MASTLSLEPKKRPHILTIAGSDSSGGAGIQADLKTIEAFGCYGSSVLTGLTAQNTKGVQAVHEIPTDFVIQQLKSVITDESPTCIKLGMLTNASIIRAMALELKNLNTINILDPVMISTSGHTLLPEDAIEALKELYPFINYFTPNIPEAIKLSGFKKKQKENENENEVGESNLTLNEMIELAKETNSKTGTFIILLKGGHSSISRKEVLTYKGKIPIIWEEGGDVNDDESDTIEVLSLYKKYTKIPENQKGLVVDILVNKGEIKALFVGKKVESNNTHGTGCTLSTAIACSYATESKDGQGEIFKRAISYTQSAIASSFPFGQGHGPLNHAHLSTRRALPPPTKHNPHPFLSHLIQSNLPLWNSYVKHPFVVQLGNGTLPRECFEHYIKQDYHYLKHYARAHALGAYKANSFIDIKAFTDIAGHIARESQMHVTYCESFGISLKELENTPESSPCSAYARYVIDIGTQGDLLDLYMSVASCLIGYGEVGLWLKSQINLGKAKLQGNLYKRWIEDYSGEDFLKAVEKGIENLERRIAEDPPNELRLARLTSIWHECVRLESAFWDMGLNLIK
uniref:Phosphomethylpyrimidine kinase n=1 Tax=Kwoniella pini CBS 10737 TaxID=1296096 RepID=A0A1B9I525_9TREE|nr:phosphomethylpyrimidine kinase [Kwoniella pini CBS 10737]OCF50581.1 phosphomethylpyrimidine kinase [Kwoniella pini CBS 10737]